MASSITRDELTRCAAKAGLTLTPSYALATHDELEAFAVAVLMLER